MASNKLLGLLLTLFLLAFLVISVESMTCEECKPEKCRIPLGCKYGYVKNACNCCYICAKGLGETCGGLWNTVKCAKGLRCQKFNVHRGVCVPQNSEPRTQKGVQDLPSDRDYELLTPIEISGKAVRKM